jgi:hypothetical protein
MSVDSTAAAASAAAVAATAAMQALSEGLHSSTFPQHTFIFLSFWIEDPVGWFMHPESEFALARVLANSYMFFTVLQNRNCIILTQDAPDPYPCSRFWFRCLS